MSVSGIPRDDAGRGSAAAAGQPVDAEEMLAELVRLVESSGLAPAAAPSVKAAPDPRRTDAGAPQAVDETWRPAEDAPPGETDQTTVLDDESPRLFSHEPSDAEPTAVRRSGAWTLKVAALVMAGAAGIGAMLWLKHEPALPRAPASVAKTQAPTAGQPPVVPGVTPSSGVAAPAEREVMQPAEGNVGAPGGPPGDGSARAALDGPPASSGPADAGAAPTAVSSPVAVAPPAAPPTDSTPMPTASLLANPAETGTPAPSAGSLGETAPPLPPIRPAAKAASEAAAPLPPVRHAPKAASEAVGGARPAPKLDLPTKLSNKSVAHSAVAKAEAPGEAQPAPPEPPAPVQPSNSNPVTHAFNSVVGAVTGLIPFVNH